MNHAHDATDEMAEFHARHITPSDLRKARFCSGSCNQGREACNCPTGAAEACSELLEDQSQSADREVGLLVVELVVIIVVIGLTVHFAAHFLSQL